MVEPMVGCSVCLLVAYLAGLWVERTVDNLVSSMVDGKAVKMAALRVAYSADSMAA